MPLESVANNIITTLNGAITNSATTLTLTSAPANMPTARFRLLIDSEIIIVGTRSGTSCSGLTRGAEGTTAASHSSGATVTHSFTAGAAHALVGTALGYYNVKDFGAIGDGSADDTAAINAAIAAVPAFSALHGSGTIYFPEGNYRVTSSINLNKGGLTFKGAGMNHTKISATMSTPVFDTPTTGGSDPIYSYMEFQDMRITNSSTNVAAKCFRLREFAEVVFRRVWFIGDTTGAGSNLFQAYTNILITFVECKFDGFNGADYCVGLGDDIGYNNVTRFRDCSFSSGKGGIRAISGAALSITGCHFENLTGTGGSGFSALCPVYLDCYNGGEITGNYFEAFSGYNIITGNTCGEVGGFVIGGNYIYNYGSGSAMDLRSLRYSTILANAIYPGPTTLNSNGIEVGDSAAIGLDIRPQYLRDLGTGVEIVSETTATALTTAQGYGPYLSNGVPASGFLNNIAKKGALVINTAAGTLYQNTGTLTATVWTAR